MRRPAFTLIELVLFIGIFVVVLSVMLPLLFSSTETRLRQQTISLVEDNGTQIAQNIARRARNAERILYPAMGSTGAVLALQHASGGLHPTILSVQTGSLILIEQETKYDINSTQVAVLDFVVRNTSATSSQQSFTYSYRVSRTIRLEQPHSYEQHFAGAVSLHPDDATVSGGCSCAIPTCSNKIFSWNICSGGSCALRSAPLDCP